jgi:hypothetical protein
VHQTGQASNAQPLHQVCAMGLDGLDTDSEGVGNLFCAVFFSNESQDLSLPFG